MPGTPLSTRSPKLDGVNPKNDPIRNIATTKTRIDSPMKRRSVSACSSHICYGRPIMAYDLWWSVRITGAIVRENRSVMDPLSDVLALLRPRTYSSGGFDAGGEWSIQFPRYEGIKCYAVVSGECWLLVEDIAEPIRLRKGDCILLPTERSFRVASDLNLASVDVKT